MREWLRLKGSPRSVQRLLSSGKHAQDGIDFTLFGCLDCGFVQAPRTLEEDYYDDYVMTATHSRQMRQYQSEQAADFVGRFALGGKSVLEVGCGDGNFLEYLHDAGAMPSGVEPSQPFRELAEKRSYPIFAEYMGRKLRVPAGPYAGFVTRQVLEHVEDPNNFLAGIRANLMPGGVGLIEVPCLEKALDQCRFYDFFPDHLNYFSASTLRYAAELNGFETLESCRGMDGEYNIVYVRRREVPDSAKLQAAVEMTASHMKDFIREQRRFGKRIALWGAGGKGLALLGAARPEGVAYVVDSDPHKWQKFTPILGLPIYPPDHLAEDPVDVVFVTALAYEQEILAGLRERGFTGTIALLGESVRIAQP
jgi:SAM-dependent methyltransferase